MNHQEIFEAMTQRQQRSVLSLVRLGDSFELAVETTLQFTSSAKQIEFYRRAYGE